MCNRVQITVDRDANGVSIRRFGSDADLVVSLSTSLEFLESAVREHLDTEQITCALALWGEDNYKRMFVKTDEGFVISCKSPS